MLVRQILGKLPAKLPENCLALFLQRFRPSQKFTPKLFGIPVQCHLLEPKHCHADCLLTEEINRELKNIYHHHPESKTRKSSEGNSGSIHPYGRYVYHSDKAIFEKRAATVEVDTLISPATLGSVCWDWGPGQVFAAKLHRRPPKTLKMAFR